MALFEFIFSKIKPYQTYIFITFLFIIFSIVSIYSYNNFVKPYLYRKTKKFKDVANNNASDIEIFLFHVDWCPHCIKSLPEWNAFVSNYDNTVVNDYKIICREIDCTKDSNTEIKNLIIDNSIQSYPTVFLIKDGKRYDYDAKITNDSLSQFITMVTNA